jgi:hypothetical protein
VWGPREDGQLQQNIAPNPPHDLDLFCTFEGADRPQLLSVGHPQLRVDFLNNPGRYRITVAVHGGNRTETIRVNIHWRGKWDDFDVS